jgi:hypothetical protein
MIKNITFGSDPEYFLKNKNENIILSAIPFIKGDKHSPQSLGNGFYILKDNILVEGNVPPTSDPVKFMNNLIELKTRINKYFSYINSTLTVHHDDCLDIAPHFLTHPEALMFGCSPYINAWDDNEHRANDLSSENFRTAGFHIHIGYELTSDNPFTKEIFNKIIAKAFDIFVIIPSLEIKADRRRFENYGGLGQYRNTSYGVECRSLGGFFVDEQYLPWVIEQVCRMLSYLKDYGNASSVLAIDKPVVKFISEDTVTFEANIYEDLQLSYREQLFNDKYKIYATV